MSEVKNSDYEELVERLSVIQSKIALGKELKTASFSGGASYSYRNAEQILTAIKPLQSELKISITCSDTLVIERCPENGIVPVGYLIATATAHYKSAEISVKGFAFFDEHLKKDGKGSRMSKEQIVGCASSYARKYALQGLLAISDGADDPDGLPQNDTAEENRQPENTAKNSEKVYQRALKALKECNTVSEMLNKKAFMTAKTPEYKADINRAYDTAVAELDALNEQNTAAAHFHNDECPF